MKIVKKNEAGVNSRELALNPSVTQMKRKTKKRKINKSKPMNEENLKTNSVTNEELSASHSAIVEGSKCHGQIPNRKNKKNKSRQSNAGHDIKNPSIEEASFPSIGTTDNKIAIHSANGMSNKKLHSKKKRRKSINKDAKIDSLEIDGKSATVNDNTLNESKQTSKRKDIDNVGVLNSKKQKIADNVTNQIVAKTKVKKGKFTNSKNSSLRERMLSRLSAARFRYINEELYTWDGNNVPSVFSQNPKSFQAYHSGFKQQTKLWPINPVDVIIKSVRKIPDSDKKVIADFGCGEAKIAQELSSNKVYSFDLVALNDRVTVCDNSQTKLYSNSVDLAVHCLSLMSTNISSYIKETNRVLRIGGLLKIAEVESRFDNIDDFIDKVTKFKFKLVKKDLSRNLFYFLDFEKTGDLTVSRKRKLPTITLLPCLYKKSDGCYSFQDVTRSRA